MQMISERDVVVLKARPSQWHISFCSRVTLAFAVKAIFDLIFLCLALYLNSVNWNQGTTSPAGISYCLMMLAKLFVRTLPWFRQSFHYCGKFLQMHERLGIICLALELLSSFLVTLIFLIMRRTPIFPALFHRRHLTNPFHYLMAVAVVAEVASLSLYFHQAESVWLRVPMFWVVPLGAYFYMVRVRCQDARQVICYPDMQHTGWTVVEQIKPGTVKLAQIA